MSIALACILALASNASMSADEKPEFTDYCDRLEQEIQGKKHGFLAGNITYYVGGYHASWKLFEDETIGLTHPFHHDLRSRVPPSSIAKSAAQRIPEKETIF